jgi:hypothetical protein
MRASIFALALLLVFSLPVIAAPPQSDDWSAGKPQAFWTFERVGDTNDIGEITKVEKGRLTMTASGADIWGSADGMSFLYQKVTGNFQATLQVISGLDAPADSFSKAGIMIRSSNDPSAAYVYLFESPRRFGVGWEGRREDGAGANFAENPTNAQPPIYLRLVRFNGTITPFTSTDGVVFQQSGSSVTVEDFPGLNRDDVLVGLAQTAHNMDINMVCEAVYGPFTAVSPLYLLSGTVTDEAGKPITTGQVKIAGARETVLVNISAEGTFSVPVPPGEYELMAIGRGVEPVGAAVKVVVKDAAVKADLKAKPVPSIDLSTSSKDVKVSVKAWGGVDDSTLIRPENLDPAKPDFKETADWWDVEWPADLQAGNPVPNYSWFWYRIKFQMPASLADFKGRAFSLWNFQVDDSDVTFFNGHYVGHMLWQWNTSRNYLIPAQYINWDGDNVIAILGNQGGGGAGSQNRAAIMTPLSLNTSVVAGKVVTETGTGAARMTVELVDASGKKYTTTTSDVDGSFAIEVAPGTYKLSVKGYAASVPAPVDVVAEPGKSVVTEVKISGAGFGPAELADVDVTKLKGEDINTEGGSTKVSGKTVTIEADGADIWGNADQFHYAYLPNKVSGDFTAAVKVIDVTQGGPTDWSKAGIMARATLDAGSVHAFAAGTFMHGVRLQWRPAADGASSDAGGDNWFRFGTWVMLVRKGNTFAAYKSEDGSNPVKIAEATIPNMPSEVFLGLAATSHAGGDVRVAKFSDFKFAPVAWEPKVAEPAVAPAVVRGDLNGDGRVGIPDATLALQIAVGILKATPAQLAAGDLNGNGRIEIAEVTKILRAAVGLEKLS